MASGRLHRSRHLSLRLILALMLVLGPLLSHALPQDMHGTDDSAVATAAMPCHGSSSDLDQTAAEDIDDGCPHCCGEGLASQCHCCNFTASAGLPELASTVLFALNGAQAKASIVDDPLPDSPDDPLYRPPIAGI